MPPPSRGRPLRQPGYAHRELIEDGQSSKTAAKHDLKRDGPGEKLEAQAHGCADDPLLRSNNGCQASSGSAGNVIERGNERHLRAPSALPAWTDISQQHRPKASQPSAEAGQSEGISADSKVGGKSSPSRPPFSSHPSRSSSSQRRQICSVNRSEAAKTVHSRNASLARVSIGSSKLTPLSIAPQSQPQEEALGNAHCMLPPTHVSTALKTVAAHRKSRTNSQMQEHGLTKASPNSKNRLTSAPKPQFSAYQQRFSPKRQKPPINAPICATTFDETVDENQFRALQDELLQLQWLLFSAGSTLQDWTESGESRNNDREKKYLQEACNVYKIEQAQQVCINGAALRNWLATDSGKSSFDKFESLAYCVQTLTDMARPQQTLCRVIEEFESWSEHRIDALGESPGACPENNLGLILPLGRAWNEARTTLTRSFEARLRSLQELGTSDKLSGLGLVLDAHTRFVKNVLDELNIIGAIHSMALDQQDAWIRDRVSDLVGNGGECEFLPNSFKRHAAWDRVP
jgi:hypothetical protein